MSSYRSYLEKNLLRLSSAIQESMFAEEAAAKKGWLQQIDSRIKVGGLLLLIIACAFSHHISVILLLLALSFLLAGGSGLLSISFIRRLWIFIPLYTALIATPAIFLTPGDPVLQVPVFGWTATRQGFNSAALLLLRVTTTVSLLLLIIFTTRWSVFLKTLRWMGVPQILVLMLAMTYRYIYVLLQSATSLFLARQSRRVGPEAWQSTKDWIGVLAGALFGKSFSLSSEIYLAMTSRGFRGEPVVLGEFQVRSSDWLWLFLFISAAGITFFWNSAL